MADLFRILRELPVVVNNDLSIIDILYGSAIVLSPLSDEPQLENCYSKAVVSGKPYIKLKF